MEIPSGIIYVNREISDSALETLQRQLLIDQTLDGYRLDDLMIQDPDLITRIKKQKLRVLVLRSREEFVNRGVSPNWTLADLVLIVSRGMAYAEINKFGPPGISLPVTRVTWGFFLFTPNLPFRKRRRCR